LFSVPSITLIQMQESPVNNRPMTVWLALLSSSADIPLCFIFCSRSKLMSINPASRHSFHTAQKSSPPPKSDHLPTQEHITEKATNTAGKKPRFVLPPLFIPVRPFIPVYPAPFTHAQPPGSGHHTEQHTALKTSSPSFYPPDVWENPVSLRELLPSNLSKVHFKQGTIGDCYLLAGLDAILHHPKAEQLLNDIMVEECRNLKGKVYKYKITFPSGRWGAFYANELGARKCFHSPLDGPDPIRMMELAYAKMTRKQRNRNRPFPFINEGRDATPIILCKGSSKHALRDMLGGKLFEFSASQFASKTQPYRKTEPLTQNPDTLLALSKQLSHLASDPDHIYVLSAFTPDETFFSSTIHTQPKDSGQRKQFYRNHSYSIRSFDPAKKTITLANPHDTKRFVDTLTLEEFCQAFQGIEGVRLPADDTGSG
jgi:hypothetical protein